MSLVGDVIISARELIPDVPQAVTPPTNATFTPSVVAAGGSTLPAGSYFMKFTLVNQWGETTSGPEFSGLNVGANQGIQVAGVLPSGTTGVKCYFGTLGAGLENQTILLTTLPGVISTPGTIGTAAPPTRNRCWLPDSDGAFVGAYNIYRWLNEALDVASKATGGIYDATGVGTIVNQPVYQLTNSWVKFTYAWYDGWAMDKGRSSDVFRRSIVTGISNIVCNLRLLGGAQLVEVYPLPNRTSGQTTLTAQLNPTDTTATIAANTFTLPYGLALLGTEIVAYSGFSGPTTMIGLQRGIGGTVASTQANGSAVVELNLRFAGFRYATKYNVGDAAKTLQVPSAWETLLPVFVESRAREMEHLFQEAAGLRGGFETEMQRLASASKQAVATAGQVGAFMQNEAYGSGLGGGWLLP